MGRGQAHRPGGGWQKDATVQIYPPLKQNPGFPHLPAV